MLTSIIVAHDSARVIGRDGGIPWHLPADLAHFKQTTMGHHLLMGRKTFESIGRALPGRRTVVISRSQPPLPEEVAVASSLEEALILARAAGETEAFVAGGGEIYRLALPRADRIYLTLVGDAPDREAPTAQPGDTLFPLWEPIGWRQVESVVRLPDESNPRPLRFSVYERLR